MQSRTAEQPRATIAAVVSLDERRSRRNPPKRNPFLVPLVAAWFGTAVLALATVLGGIVLLAYAHPAIGLPALFAVATVACVSPARRWLGRNRP